MKKILFLSAGIAALFLQTASAQYPIGSVDGIESWENTLDGWTVDPLGKNPTYTGSFSTAFGVTDGGFSLALTGTAYPNYAQLLSTPTSTNLTALLADCASVSISVYVPAGAFANYLAFDFDVANADLTYAGYNDIPGYVSINGFNSYVTAYSGGGNWQTNISVPMPAGIAAQLALSTNPTTLYIQIGGSYTAGNETMYLDNFQIVPTVAGTVPTPTKPVIVPTNTFFAQSASGVTLFETSHGIKPLYYQWQTDGGGNGGVLTNIPDATVNTYAFNTTVAGTYNFACVVTNGANGYSIATSAVAQVFVLPASVPILTTDITPTNIYGFIGGNVSFYAYFGLGTMPNTNQWLFSSTGSGYAPVAGVANNPWTCTNVQPSSTGFYKLSATNVIGSSNSTPAHLTALADPAALPAPANGSTTNMYSYGIYTNHPWAYWKFEETNDTLSQSMQAYDYSGHNFDATYGNKSTVLGSGCLDGGETIHATGQYGPGNNDGYSGFTRLNGCSTMAYNLDNGYLTVPPLNLYTNTVTLTMWIYINPSDNIILPSTGLFMNRNGNDAAGILFGTNVKTNFDCASGVSIAELGYAWNNNSAATTAWHSGLYPSPCIWNFVACVITPSNTTMYLYNASTGAYGKTNLVKAVNNVTNGPEAFSTATWIGSAGYNGSTFDGYMDEVAVFTNAMSESQIQYLFLTSVGLTNGVAPSITTEPARSATLYQGQTLQLSAMAGGIPTPTYQWQCTSNSGASWTNVVNANAIGTTTPNLVISNFPPNAYTTTTNFQVVVANSVGSVTSTPVSVVIVRPTIPNYKNGKWTMNFAIATTTQNGTGAPFTGRGVLGAAADYYWNALNAYSGQVTNVTAYLDDGTANPATTNIVFSTPVGAGLGSGSSLWTGVTNNTLLDTYMIVNGTTNNPTPFVFSKIPNGRYNLALYGCVGNWLNRAIQFTVLTNGAVAGTAAMTNLQDIVLAPNDNTSVFTNLLVTNQRLEVDIGALPCLANPSSTECEFNGAQLELISYGPTFSSSTSGGHTTLNWSYGMLLQSTNLFGPWTTNTATTASGSYLINPTGYMRYFRVYDPTNL